MKNLNILLATAMVFSSAAVCAAAAEAQISKLSPDKKFFGVMTCDDKGNGVSLTVKNLETNTVVITVNSEAAVKKTADKKATSKRTIKSFELTNDTLVVKYKFSIKNPFRATKVTYALTAPKCKKCEKELNAAVGAVVKAKAFEIFPAAKK